MYGGTKTDLLYKATKLVQWALAVSIMVIVRIGEIHIMTYDVRRYILLRRESINPKSVRNS